MVIKNVNLETVCGITSKLPDHTVPSPARKPLHNRIPEGPPDTFLR